MDETTFGLHVTGFNKHVDKLFPDQKKFSDLILDWVENRKNQFVIVTGSPGTGKTFTVVETLRYVALEVKKMAPTGRLAQMMNGSTLHAGLKMGWDVGSPLADVYEEIEALDMEEKFDPMCLELSDVLQDVMMCDGDYSIIAIDEIGMIPVWFLYQIVQKFFNTCEPCLVVGMGDEHQLRPVNFKYNIFDVVPKNLNPIVIRLHRNNRFTDEYALIIETLKQQMDSGLPMLEFVKEKFPIVNQMTESLLLSCDRVLAYKCRTVESYNDRYLSLIPKKAIRLCKVVRNKLFEDSIILKENCPIMTTSRPNGNLHTFQRYDENEDVLWCNNDVKIVRAPGGMFPVVLAFAITIHKCQGSTMDEKIIIDFDGCQDKHLIYTALSRVRSMDQIVGILNVEQ